MGQKLKRKKEACCINREARLRNPPPPPGKLCKARGKVFIFLDCWLSVSLAFAFCFCFCPPNDGAGSKTLHCHWDKDDIEDETAVEGKPVSGDHTHTGQNALGYFNNSILIPTSTNVIFLPVQVQHTHQ